MMTAASKDMGMYSVPLSSVTATRVSASCPPLTTRERLHLTVRLVSLWP